MGKGYSNISQNRTVREVTLQSGNGKLGGQMLKNGIGQTKVSFGIFKIDGVYFVWHGRRAYFSLFDFLLKIIHGNVGPHISIQIDQNGIDALEAIEQSRHVVVMLNLSSGERV